MTGPSGSGKTTFLNIAGLLEEFDERRLRARRPRHCDPIRQRDLARAQREDRLHLPELQFDPGTRTSSTTSTCRCATAVSGAAERKKRIERSLEGWASRRACSICRRSSRAASSSESRSRVRSRASRASCSPTSLRATSTRRWRTSVLDLLAEINATGTTIIMVTHELALANRAERNIFVRDGHLADRPPGIPPRGRRRAEVDDVSLLPQAWSLKHPRQPVR